MLLIQTVCTSSNGPGYVMILERFARVRGPGKGYELQIQVAAPSGQTYVKRATLSEDRTS